MPTAFIPYEVIPPPSPDLPACTEINIGDLCREAADAARKASTQPAKERNEQS